MFEVVMKLLNRNQKTSKEIAKDRLKVVLIHDRANISPEVIQHFFELCEDTATFL